MDPKKTNSTKKKKIPGGYRFFKQGTLLQVKANAKSLEISGRSASNNLVSRPGVSYANLHGPSGNPNNLGFFLYPHPEFPQNKEDMLSAMANVLVFDSVFLVVSGPRWLSPGQGASLDDNYYGFKRDADAPPLYKGFVWYAIKVLANDKLGWLILLNDKSPKTWFDKAKGD